MDRYKSVLQPGPHRPRCNRGHGPSTYVWYRRLRRRLPTHLNYGLQKRNGNHIQMSNSCSLFFHWRFLNQVFPRTNVHISDNSQTKGYSFTNSTYDDTLCVSYASCIHSPVRLMFWCTWIEVVSSCMALRGNSTI